MCYGRTVESGSKVQGHDIFPFSFFSFSFFRKNMRMSYMLLMYE